MDEKIRIVLQTFNPETKVRRADVDEHNLYITKSYIRIGKKRGTGKAMWPRPPGCCMSHT